MDKRTAHATAERHGIPLNFDFHALPHDVVLRIIEAANERRYRKPKNANGSRARYFYQYLNNSANRER